MKSNSIIKIIIISSICLAAIVIFVLAFNFENLVSSASPDNLKDIFAIPPISSPEDESVSDEISSIEETPSETLPEETLPEETLPEETDTPEDLELLKYFTFTELYNGLYGISLSPNAPPLTEITIPKTFRGKAVRRIMSEGFKNCTSLKTLNLSNINIMIEDYAFENCTALQTVNSPTSLMSFDIGNKAFAGCTSLESIQLRNPDFIDPDAFLNCDSLHTITLSGSADNTDYSLPFLKNVKITHVILERFYPTSEMFKLFTDLTDIDLSNQSYIPKYLFSGCSNLSNITIGKNIFLLEDGIFENCPAIQQISIPKSITSIGEGVFAGSTNLCEIYYEGTLDDWEKIRKDENWDADTGEYIIYCSNGSILKYNDSENA